MRRRVTYLHGNFLFGILRARIPSGNQDGRNIIDGQTVGIHKHDCNVINNRPILSACNVGAICDSGLYYT